MIQLVEVFNEVSSAMRGTSKYTLREIYINPKHVVAIRPDNRMNTVLKEGLLPEGMDERQSFTKVFLDRGWRSSHCWQEIRTLRDRSFKGVGFE